MYTIFRNLSVNALTAPADIDRRIGAVAAKTAGLPPDALRSWRILAKSVDSRRGAPQLVYTLLAEVEKTSAAARKLEPVPPEMLAQFEAPRLELPETTLLHPLVVGTGPAGIFAALALAMAGTRPIVLDRGPEVEPRFAAVQHFLETRELEESANLLIGEGGAGTFSDGKLYTGTRDGNSGFILNAFAEAGAPAEIRYLKRPHIGSDRLRLVAAGLRKRILDLGGEFRFGVEVTDLLLRDGRCRGVVTASGETIEAPLTLIAAGLGGRELSRRLRERGAACEFKSFQIGCRIEHPQELVDRRQYRLPGSRPEALGAAEYHMVSHPQRAPGVSTFCMCPGGEILNATAWRGRSVTNGMSDYARAGEFANSCLIVTFPPEKFTGPDAAYARLEALEKAVFEQGGRDYTLPAQDAAAFLRRRNGLSSRRTSCRCGIVPGRIDRLLPEELGAGIAAAFAHFDRLMPGFIRHGRLIGAETCVSSPLRFLRDPATLESSLAGLYLGGEGAGCAGGIMSAAADGLRLALAMLRRG